ncbi:MAG: ATP-grasp domain-containing protein [Sedimentisphaerales bacterium]|nr:ATP-grasp domain-containing protein [Sedimentisphaerales bacterium]
MLESFRKAAKSLKIQAKFLGTDITTLSPALQLCDDKFIVKPISDPGYIRQLLSIVKNNQVKLLVPTIDTELKLLAQNKKKFAELGCHVLVSPEEVIDICMDKRETYRFLIKHGFESPVTMTAGATLSKSTHKWPYLLKPWDGSAGKDIHLVNNLDELKFFARKTKNAICQEYIKGEEYTCDVYVDLEKKVRCVVPRKRLEVRAGEVSKSQIAKNHNIMEQAAKVIEALGAGPGVITIQLFLTSHEKLVFTEINPRFGGGAPLSIKAGANFPKWIVQELSSQQPNIKFGNFKDNMIMLRYDSEVWVDKIN